MTLYRSDMVRASQLLGAFLVVQEIEEAERAPAWSWPSTPEVDDAIWELTDRSYDWLLTDAPEDFR